MQTSYIHSFKEQNFSRIVSVLKKKLINIHGVYMGHNIHCTVLVAQVLGTAELAISRN